MNKKKQPRKLALAKMHIIDLTVMAHVKGGFTYSLSLGWKCQDSKAAGADNLSECARIHNETPVGSPDDISSKNV